MSPDPRAILWDAHQAALKIERFLQDVALDAYIADDEKQSAVERQFAIIGEALNRLRGNDPAIAGRIASLPEIIGFRNVLIHGYAVIDVRRVWGIAQTLLPQLRMTLGELLRELDGSSPDD